MDKLLWLGEPLFAAELAPLGWSAASIAPPLGQLLSWRDLKNLAGFEPDVLVVADNGNGPYALGIENFPCLTVFYSLATDVPAWQPGYAQAFDACLVTAGHQLGLFSGDFLQAEHIWWSPPFAREEARPSWEAEKIWDCLSVRGESAKTEIFLNELALVLPGLQVRSGDFRDLFPKARIVVNHSPRGNLEFGVFDAMACGSCLVTPRVGQGMERLFVDGEHLVGYTAEDAGDAAYRINFLLAHPDVAVHIAKTASAEIEARHRPRHRAEAMTDHLCDLLMNDVAAIIGRRRGNGAAIRNRCLSRQYLRLGDETPFQHLKATYLAAARGKFGLNGIEA